MIAEPWKLRPMPAALRPQYLKKGWWDERTLGHMLLDWLAMLPNWRSQLFRWGDLQFRLTQGFPMPGYGEDDVRLALGR